MEAQERISVVVNSNTKRKAVFVLKSKGKNLTDMVNEQLKKYADEFDKIK